MEPQLRADLSAVKVHRGPLAGAAAADLNARAFALGPNVVFGAGAYAPESAEGRRTLAHELAHVVQSGTRPSRTPFIVGSPFSPAEAEADKVADRIAASSPSSAWDQAGESSASPVRQGLQSPGRTIARQPVLNTEQAVDGASTPKSAGQQALDQPPSTAVPASSTCCCCAGGIDLSDFWFQRWPAPSNLVGHFFRPVINLTYQATGTHSSCSLEWWEKTNVPYEPLVRTANQWTRITDPKAGSIEKWKQQVKEPWVLAVIATPSCLSSR
jgi:hypothetical protein